MIIASALALGAFAPGCHDVDGDYASLVPERYDKIVSFKDAGNVEVEMSVAETAHRCELPVLKGGIRTDAEVEVLLDVLDQSYVDTEYNEKQGMNYRVLSAGMYTVTDYRLTIPSGETGSSVTVKLNARKIYSAMLDEENEGREFVLPVRLTSLTDSISAVNNEVVLHCSVSPAVVSFDEERASVALPETQESAVADLTVHKIGTVDSEVTFTVLDQPYVDATWAQPEGIDYCVLPDDAWQMDDHASIEAEVEFYRHPITFDVTRITQLCNEQPSAIWVLPVRMVALDDYVGVDRGECLLVCGFHSYETQEIATKESWSVAYGTIAMPFGPYAQMYDGVTDGGGWMGFINDGFPGSQNLGHPYVVLDLGGSFMLSDVSVQLGEDGGGFWDTMPAGVDFYITETASLNPDLTDTERGLLNATGNYGDPNNVSDAYLELHNRLHAFDDGVEWIKIGSLRPEVSKSGCGLYNVTVPQSVLSRRIVSRYLKIECTPAAFGITTGDRTKIHEVYAGQVVKIDGKPLD